jgi:hypothetical protein
MKSGANMIASVVITNGFNPWNVDSDGANGAVNQVDVPINVTRTLISTGSVSTHNIRAGRFSATQGLTALNGQVAVEANRAGNDDCNFFYTRLSAN